MLLRGIELMRVLQQRQRFIGRLVCVDGKNGFNRADRHFSYLLNDLQDNCHKRQSSRCYTTKDSKILAAPIKAAASSASNASTTEKPTTKTKTTQKTATEPKPLIDKASQQPTLAPAMTTAKHIPLPAVPSGQTKTMEVHTSKGVLSITTTIEDSKINEVVFEKTKIKPNPPPIPAAKVKADEIVKDTIKATIKSDTKTEVVTAVMAANEKAAESLKEAALSAIDDAATTKAAAAAIAAAIVTPEAKPKPPRIRVDLNRSSLERNFITPARAISDFLLKTSDLDTLSKIKRRSPYEQEPPITVFWRKDVEAKAYEVWGSRENLLKETLKREIEQKTHQQNIFTVKRRLRDYRREIGSRAVVYDDEPGLKGKSGKVVLIAIGINAINFLFKTCGWLYTGSHSMFAEAIHSLADTINQLILAYGIHKSVQIADNEHPYGYANMKYVSSLISGVGIFCVGTGLSYYHGITGLMHPEPMQDFFWAFFILGGSLVSEGATLLVAVNEVRRSAKIQGVSFKEYVLSGKDPCVNVVLTEDAAAVTSVGVAVACMGLSSLTGSPMFDAVGSLLVGSILGGVASFIIYTNVAALVGKSIAEEKLDKINAELESDVMIRAIHDVKGIDMGNSLVRYKAEMDFDGRELTRSYLDKQDLNELLKVVKSFQSIEELEQFLLNHGENIVDLMGGEIDRIEMKLRKKFPEIRHCDLEIL